MAEAVVPGTVAESVPEESPARERIICKVCTSDEMRRMKRQGFMQENIYALLGFFPWRCLKCGTRAMLHKRHRRKIQGHAE